jgi:predicted nucleic acid-binding Zn ribbon protein
MNIPFFRQLPRRAMFRRNAKQEALAEWRHSDSTEQEGARRTTEKTIADIMPGVLQRLRIDQRQAETEILKVWASLVDPEVAAHANPTGIRNGTLFVSVDSNVWLDEIVRYRRREILDRLKSAFGPTKVLRISFRIG